MPDNKYLDEYELLPILEKYNAADALPEIEGRFNTVCGDFMEQLDNRKTIPLVEVEFFLRNITQDEPESGLVGKIESYVAALTLKRRGG